MSPTLLELVVAVLLLWAAWQIAALIGPRVMASFLSFWRGARPPMDRSHQPFEKNITPPRAPDPEPPPSHDPLRK